MIKEKLSELEKFEDDLIMFIRNHNYVVKFGDDFDMSRGINKDKVEIRIPIVDGDYKEINISIIYKS